GLARCARVAGGRGVDYFSTSSLTLALPLLAKPSSSAAFRVTSITALFDFFIRSLIVTTTLFPFATLVTFTFVPSGRLLWDAVIPFLSYGSPLDVFFPWNLSL